MQQLIIIKRDSTVTPTEFASQVANASMAFLTQQICTHPTVPTLNGYNVAVLLDKDTLEQWFQKDMYKFIYQVEKNKTLLIARTTAEKLGLRENKDFFLMKNSQGKITCISFKPLDNEIVSQILSTI